MTQAMPATNSTSGLLNCHERAQGTHFCPSCGTPAAARQRGLFHAFEMPRKLWIDMNFRTEISAIELEAAS
jgi:hypothetical protein